MAIVRATCAACGDVELGIADVQIQVCASNASATYSFRCPACLLITTKEAGERVYGALSAAGCEIVMWTMPAELHEQKLGPPITHDDLLAFHLALEDDGWVEELASAAKDRVAGSEVTGWGR
ncbi:MAG TPA: hypothetical protein VFH56_10030 [Acidimicrobiales bacterium]|nr:hypothetical protein [Acidimicrobiales bacterium]